MSEVVYKLVVEVDQKEVHSVALGSHAVSGLISGLPFHQGDENASLYEYLALSPSSGVRRDVAGVDFINEHTLALLAKDDAIDVRRAISANAKFRDWATTEILSDYIRSDIECAKEIAGSLGDFTCADASMIAAVMCGHSDPEVRLALARSYSAPKKFVKQLVTDPDQGVRAEAKYTLSRV